MRDQDTNRESERDGTHVEQPATEAYEPPAIEDLPSVEGPTVTAAGIPITQVAAPRKL